MKWLTRHFIRFYDYLFHYWEKPSTERYTGLILLWIYILSLIAVELKRQGLFPAWLPQPPEHHYYSIQLAFTLILGLEVISLIFIIPSSLAKSLGKQMEILTLILLRNSFKELSILPEPINVELANIDPVFNIAISASGALCVFLCLGIYRNIYPKGSLMPDPLLVEKFVFAKKIAFFLFNAHFYRDWHL